MTSLFSHKPLYMGTYAEITLFQVGELLLAQIFHGNEEYNYEHFVKS